MELDSGDIARVALEGEDGGWVRGSYVVKLDGMMTSGGQKSLVWRDC